jgi:hypothetical protein
VVFQLNTDSSAAGGKSADVEDPPQKRQRIEGEAHAGLLPVVPLLRSVGLIDCGQLDSNDSDARSR